ncbi:MAG: cytochrome c3 family protein [Syntrophobacteraceae bacterium]
MKTGGSSIIFGLVAAMIVLAAIPDVVATGQKPPKTITLKAGDASSQTSSAVTFPHKKHAEKQQIACDKCHHAPKDGVNTWKRGDPVAKCESCHTQPTMQGEQRPPHDQKNLNLTLAFHNRCLGCHKEEKKNKPDTNAPIVCDGCH